MYRDYKDLLSVFQSHGVKYLIVGGFAVIYHSQPRFTKDMDLFIKADSENAKATYAALAAFGAPLQGMTPEDFTDRESFFRFGREPKGFDIRNLPAQRQTSPSMRRWRSSTNFSVSGSRRRFSAQSCARKMFSCSAAFRSDRNAICAGIRSRISSDCQWRRSGIGRIEDVSQSSVPEEAWVGFADNLIEVRFSFPRLHLLVFE